MKQKKQNIQKYNVQAEYLTLGFEGLNKKFFIYESKYWTWSLAAAPRTLGSGVVCLKRMIEKIEDITHEEWIDSLEMKKMILKCSRELFDCKGINFLMLMNQDRQVHEHIVPRYYTNKEFNGEIFYDDERGMLSIGMYMHDNTYTEKTLLLIRDKLKEEIKKQTNIST